MSERCLSCRQGREALGSKGVLHSFTNTGADGQNPWSSLVLDTHGNLYGTTLNGGANCDCGTVFVVKP